MSGAPWAAHDRPFRSPHHTISDAGLVGGGPLMRPGELSMAHHGVLFLDELAELRKNVLEVLRQPLEEGQIPGVHCNAQMPPALLRRHCALRPAGRTLLARAVHDHGLSARAHDRILKLARTRADLEGREQIDESDLCLAIDCRMMDRKSWAWAMGGGGNRNARVAMGWRIRACVYQPHQVKPMRTPMGLAGNGPASPGVKCRGGFRHDRHGLYNLPLAMPPDSTSVLRVGESPEMTLAEAMSITPEREERTAHGRPF